jgi:RNA polymerase sigma-70 factor (ECF subfamily)
MSDDLTISLDLVRKAQGGDEASLNRLIERYYERVRRIVRLRLGTRLRQGVDSGDILQETFIAAVRSFETFEMRDEASLINWLSRLAERQIIAAADYHGAKKRDHKKRVALPGSSTGESVGQLGREFATKEPHPLEQLLESETNEQLEGCLQGLSEEHRELIILRNYAGCSWETVAKETGRPTASAARMMHARAMIELGKKMREQGAF